MAHFKKDGRLQRKIRVQMGATFGNHGGGNPSFIMEEDLPEIDDNPEMLGTTEAAELVGDYFPDAGPAE